jgi:D-alanyl-D-alanine-carboxypeptidase/D-alanyl-D-alanine-endopeptidase
MTRFLPLLLIAACSSPAVKPVAKPKPTDVDGPHKAAVAAQVKPYLDGQILSGLVIGLYDAGKIEIYGFGKGPGDKPPTGDTLYELGSITKIYTSLLLADAVQRKEVQLEQPLADLVPPGVTVPTRDQKVITLKHLVLHSSGLPRLPGSIRPDATDPYGKYSDDMLLQDLIQANLDNPPGEQIVYSNFGVGLLGFVLGKKIGGGYGKALEERILKPLALTSTFISVPAAAGPRRATPTNDDLAPVPAWTWTDALAGAGALTSSARDQLKLIDAELDAAAGSKSTLRGAMRFTQEEQLADRPSENSGLGWVIDPGGRLIHNGGTTGSRSFIGFDPKTRRGIVVLASTGSSLVDRLGGLMFDVLENTAKPPPALPTAAQLAVYAGSYDFTGTKLAIVVANNRLYIEGPGEPRHRLVPLTDVAFWIEALQAVAFFHKDGEVVKQVVFQVGDRQLVAPRLP